MHYAKETQIRNAYMQYLHVLRPEERCLSRECAFSGSRLRTDMLTVDTKNVLRNWEFKIHADYRALGQVLTYMSCTKLERNFQYTVNGVIAAFSFQQELVETIHIWGFPIELVTIPPWLKQADKLCTPPPLCLPVDPAFIRK